MPGCLILAVRSPENNRDWSGYWKFNQMVIPLSIWPVLGLLWVGARRLVFLLDERLHHWAVGRGPADSDIPLFLAVSSVLVYSFPCLYLHSLPFGFFSACNMGLWQNRRQYWVLHWQLEATLRLLLTSSPKAATVSRRAIKCKIDVGRCNYLRVQIEHLAGALEEDEIWGVFLDEKVSVKTRSTVLRSYLKT